MSHWYTSGMTTSPSSSAFTEGPWFVTRSETPDVYKGQRHFAVVDQKTHTTIADIETTENGEANARLISKSTDLLEACKMMAEWIERFPRSVATTYIPELSDPNSVGLLWVLKVIDEAQPSA